MAKNSETSTNVHRNASPQNIFLPLYQQNVSQPPSNSYLVQRVAQANLNAQAAT